MRLILLTALLSLLVLACKTPSQSLAQADPAHSSRNSLDWDGRYQGQLPCADCAAIQTTLTLKADQTYEFSRVYEGKNEKAVVQSGSFSWDEAGQRVTLKGPKGSKMQYFVGEGYLQQLDPQGERITGELADRYRMKKIPPMQTLDALYTHRWELVALAGQDYPHNSGRVPYLEFDREGQRLTGFGGCNRLMGTFETGPDMSLTFGPTASTKMACPQLQTENKFTQALSQTTRIKLDGHALELFADTGPALARLLAKPKE
jgi:copper homeostasis protein (lipoprotein)